MRPAKVSILSRSPRIPERPLEEHIQSRNIRWPYHLPPLDLTPKSRAANFHSLERSSTIDNLGLNTSRFSSTRDPSSYYIA
jgi:hypothetical protein